jgi:hypothetical protein
MGKKVALVVLALLAFGATIFMYHGGETNPAWTEMKGVWWIPLPVGILSLLLAFKK